VLNIVEDRQLLEIKDWKTKTPGRNQRRNMAKVVKG
jgi:hypothetical protein